MPTNVRYHLEDKNYALWCRSLWSTFYKFNNSLYTQEKLRIRSLSRLNFRFSFNCVIRTQCVQFTVHACMHLRCLCSSFGSMSNRKHNELLANFCVSFWIDCLIIPSLMKPTHFEIYPQWNGFSLDFQIKRDDEKQSLFTRKQKKRFFFANIELALSIILKMALLMIERCS